MVTRSAAILVLALGVWVAGACGGRALKAGAGRDGGISAGAGGNGGETGGSSSSLLPCSTLDESSCRSRRDCQVQTCVTCGVTGSSCFRIDETPAACPLHTCVRATCTGMDEANCNAASACAAIRCPDCRGGMVFAACAEMGDQVGCGPCPPVDAGGAADSSGNGGRDECSADSDCAPPNLCALGADGVHHCVARAPRPGVDLCPARDTGSVPCCMSDSECTGAPHGICVGWSQIWCGGPQPPPGNLCEYDECRSRRGLLSPPRRLLHRRVSAVVRLWAVSHERRLHEGAGRIVRDGSDRGLLRGPDGLLPIRERSVPQQRRMPEQSGIGLRSWPRPARDDVRHPDAAILNHAAHQWPTLREKVGPMRASLLGADRDLRRHYRDTLFRAPSRTGSSAG